MRSTKTSKVRLQRRSALLALTARRGVVRSRLRSGLGEIFQRATITQIGISDWDAHDRMAGRRVVVKASLPDRYCEVDFSDFGVVAGLAESQLTVALLPLCKRVWTAHIRVKRDRVGQHYCIAHLWVDSLRLPRR